MVQYAIEPGSTWDYQVMINGFNHTIPDEVDLCTIDAAGPLAAGTITMPANPVDKQEITIMALQSIKKITLNPNAGQAVRSPIVTLAQDGFARWKFNQFNLGTPTWIRIG